MLSLVVVSGNNLSNALFFWPALAISRLIFAKYQPPLEPSDPFKRVNPARPIYVAKTVHV
jgi:hypothetical protein